MAGMKAIGNGVDAIVIVDVLSFSTAVDVAISRGASVFPYLWRINPWRDNSARQFAAAHHAMLAGPRGTDGQFSLSPSSLFALQPGSALVLPSPNGSSLSFSTQGVPTFTACLRNAPRVAKQAALRGSHIAVVPAGEQWPNDTLRPGVEDLIGAGAVLLELPGTKSPEAMLAIAAFLSCRGNLPDVLSGCSSGRELIGRGFVRDVEIAAEYAVSSAAPLLVDGRFVDDVQTHDVQIDDAEPGAKP